MDGTPRSGVAASLSTSYSDPVSSSPHPTPTAVLFDFGGVITTSPFDAFARFEAERGLPEGLIRSINAANPDGNAWAKLERSEVDVDGFASLFEAEARARGHRLDAHEVLACLSGDLRPAMVSVLHHLSGRVALALLTNNFVQHDRNAAGPMSEVLDLFDVIVESSTAGCRKPDPRFYELALEQLGISARTAVFLDDLGINLKPARTMGMRTIKVTDPDVAIAELEALVGFPLRPTTA
jgi:putative hydrolase of the HAD superfamily